jgi:hypothetical protein
LGHLSNKAVKLRDAERDRVLMDVLLGKVSQPKARSKKDRRPSAEASGERVYVPNEEARLKWVWVYCVSPFCNHARAAPLAPWRIRWGSKTHAFDAAILSVWGLWPVGM